MTERRQSRRLSIGDVPVGGAAEVSVQSMTNTATSDVSATTSQIARLAEAGCDIVRVAVPDMEAADALSSIRRASSLPVVADVHFDYRIAIAALKSGADALRLNPGNIRRHEHLKAVVDHARERQTPIRIGVNAGSLPKGYLPEESLAGRMVALAEEQIQVLERLGFGLIKVSLKASSVLTTVAAYRLMADRSPYPLHLGVTEAGPPITGAVRNTLGIGILLNEGIGDTIRVSLSGDPVLEVDVGCELLRSLELKKPGPTVISCPTCGRTTLDVPSLATRITEHLRGVEVPIRVAIMGCVVNGPGECREADVGVAGGENKVAVYRNGIFSHSVPVDDAFSALTTEIDAITGPIADPHHADTDNGRQ